MVAGTQGGKALPVKTLIPTPLGFRQMGDLKVGDEVYGQNGIPCIVTFVTPIQYNHKLYRVIFDDGSSIIADTEHRWLTQNARQRKNAARRVPNKNDWTVRTTADIRDTLTITNCGKKRANYSIDIADPVQYPERVLAVPPYTLGAWLGDGSATKSGITCADEAIIQRIRADDVFVGKGHKRASQGKALTYYLGGCARVDRARNKYGQYISEGILPALKEIGVLGNKHIPQCYLIASFDQRLALVQGLMDTDGYVALDGRCEFSVKSKPLATGMLELLRSLGIKARMATNKAALYGKDYGLRYRVSFTTTLPVVTLDRKSARIPLTIRPDMRRRFIKKIEPVESEPVRCITVDGPDHLYLAGREYISTHNTVFGPRWLYREIYGGEFYPGVRHAGRGRGDYLAATSTYELFKLKMLPALLSCFEHLYNDGRYWAGDRLIELRDPETGKFWAKKSSDPMWGRIILRAASSEGGLESTTANAAWLDECGQSDFRITAWEAVLRRLSIAQGRVLGTTTPYNLGWLKTQIVDPWERGDDPDIDVIRFSSIANPAFPIAEYERARRTMQPWRFNMFYNALFEVPPGLIYQAWQEMKAAHIVEPFKIPGYWPRYAGWDFGGVHMATLWMTRNPHTNELFVFNERMAGEMTVKSHAQETKDWLDKRGTDEDGHSLRMHNTYMWGGSASEGQERRDYAEFGIPIMKPPVSSVEMGLDRGVSLLTSGRVKVFSTCKQFLDELDMYSREVDDLGEPTEAIKDKANYHFCDCWRYMSSGFKQVDSFKGLRGL